MIKVFISYAHEDLAIAKKIYSDLKYANVNVWMDHEDLLPGQNWRLVVEKEIKSSTYFLALLSTNSINKRGFVQKELSIAIDILDEIPEGRIFIIPVRIDECKSFLHRLSDLHWIDLFESYENNLEKIFRTISYQEEKLKTNGMIKAKKFEGYEEVYTFRFRAECEHDVNELYRIICPHVKRLTKTNAVIDLRKLAPTEEDMAVGKFFPLLDIDVEIETDLSLKELRKAMLQVLDGHLMIETLS